MPKMTESDLKQLVMGKLRTAEIFTTAIQDEREKAWDYYNQEKFGDEQEDFSQVITSDVRDVVEWTLPNLMDMLYAADTPVEFTPNGQQDVEAAKIETKYVTNVIFDQRDSYLKIYTWLKDGLIQKNGIVKAYWDETQDDVREEWKDLNEVEYQNAISDETVEVLEHTVKFGGEEYGEDEALAALEDAIANGMTPDVTGATHDVVLRRRKNVGRICVENIAPEYFYVDRDHDSIDLQDAGFVCEIVRTTAGALIEEGYPAKLVESIQTDSEDVFNQEHTNRFEDEGGGFGSDEKADDVSRDIYVYEAYLQADFDGDGKPEMRFVKLAGTNGSIVLENEEVDRHPFHAWTPNILPHKFYGRSLADDVMDIQKVNSVLWRQSLDNLYLTNSPSKIIVDGQVNIDDLLNRRPGGVIRAKGPDVIRDDVVPFVGQHSIGMMEVVKNMRAERTGVSPEQQGLNPEAMANSTNMVGAMILNNAQLRVKMIARNFAEIGLKSLVCHVHELVRKYEDNDKIMRAAGGYVNVNPKEWRERTDVSVRVGIGFADRREYLNTVERIIGLQEKVVAVQGPEGPLLGVNNLYQTLDNYLDRLGVRDTETYFRDPQTYNAPPPKDEPLDAAVQVEEAKITVNAQVEMAKLEGAKEERQLKLRQLEMEKEENDRRHELELRRLQLEYGKA